MPEPQEVRVKWVIFAICLGFALLLFVRGPGADAPRVYQEIWDTGHLPAFGFFSWLLLSSRRVQRLSWPIRGLLVTVFCLVSGFLVEGLQLLVGRDFEVKDIINDLLGGWSAFLVRIATDKYNRRRVRIAALPLVAVALAGGLRMLFMVSIDYWTFQRQFPVLCDYETPFELMRWDTCGAELAREHAVVRTGKHAMRIRFFPVRDPDATLRGFPSDWRGFGSLNLSIYNPTDHDQLINLMLYDQRQVDSEMEYLDRYNREIALPPGWNDINVRLADVRNAPRDRKTDLSRIDSLSIFLHGPEHPVDLFLDSVRLSPE